MGLVARLIEERGIATIVLTPTPEFNREVGFPRIAAIAYPYGRVTGEVHDKVGQKKVLLETLAVLANAQNPGEVVNLPFVWPEAPKDAKWHPPEISPLIKLFLNEIKEARRSSKS